MPEKVLRFSLIIIFGAIIASCTERRVLILSDPYVNLVQKGTWPAAGITYRFLMFINGFSSRVKEIQNQDEIREILQNNEQDRHYTHVIISPWNLRQLQSFLPGPERYIVVGGGSWEKNLTDKSVNLVSIVINRDSSMMEVAEIASRISKKKNKPPLVIFETSTSRGMKERDIFLSRYNELSDVSPVIQDIEDEGKALTDIEPLAKTSSLMVLFAGIHNITMLEQSDNSGIPVITEGIANIDIWKERIVASVEPDKRDLRRILLRELKSPESVSTLFFDSHIVKGDVYRLSDQ